MIYAQLNDNNICIGISDLSGEVNSSNLIALDEYDLSVMGKQYKDGEWLEVEAEAEVQKTPTSNEEIKVLLLAQMGAMADMFEAMMEG